jgi:hypothetical protein
MADTAHASPDQARTVARQGYPRYGLLQALSGTQGDALGRHWPKCESIYAVGEFDFKLTFGDTIDAQKKPSNSEGCG